MTRPPCWPDGQPCPNSCAQALYERDVYGKQYLTAQWQGWRLAGRVLVSPDGDRISPERLRGILFAESMRTRRRAGLPGGRSASVVRIRAREEITARETTRLEASP